MEWGAHAVWFYKSLFVMAEYGGGRAGYGFSGSKFSTPVNFSGWFVQAAYILTGEELTRRVSVLQPRQDFNFDWFRGGELRRRRRASSPVQHDESGPEHLHRRLR